MFKKIFLLLCFLTISISADQVEFYIDNTAPDGGDGTSHETAWNEISDINWESAMEVILNFVPSEIDYTADDLIPENNVTSFIRVKTCSSFVIRKDPDFEGTVIFNGIYEKNGNIFYNDFGVNAIPILQTPILDNITIEGIIFKNFNLGGVKVRGWTGTTPRKANVVIIQNCTFDNIRDRAISIQYASNCKVLNNYITQLLNIYSETDGIFLNDNCSIALIENNYVEIRNHYWDTAYHVDGIQIAKGFTSTIDLGHLMSRYRKTQL